MWYHISMNDKEKETILSIAASHKEIKLVYLFGSQVKGDAGPLSDYDIAFYADEQDRKALFDLKLDLMTEIEQGLGKGNIDIVILNTAAGPELKYHIIKDGELIYDVEPFRVLVEPGILNEYFDYHDILARYDLTGA